MTTPSSDHAQAHEEIEQDKEQMTWEQEARERGEKGFWQLLIEVFVGKKESNES